MKNTNKTFSEAFKDSFNKAFGFLVSEHQFSFVEEPETVYTGRNKSCEVTVSWDRPFYITVSIKPPYYYKPSLELQQIVHYFNPEIGLEVKNIKEDEMGDEMMRMVQLLKEYCTPMLKGDFSEWHKIWEHYNAVKK